MADATTTALVAAAVAAATLVADAADAGLYATRQAAESAIAAARTAIQTAIDAVRTAYPVTGFPVVQHLKALAAGLLELGRTLAEALATETITLLSERGLLDLARERYADAADGDLVGWAVKLHALNPTLPTPTRIPSGTTLTVYLAPR